MNFAQLRAFNAVATHRTFMAAAQALGVTQSAITQNIKALEESIGTSLFTRTGTRVELKASAYDLLPRVREVVLALEELSSRISKTRDLRLGQFLPPRLDLRTQLRDRSLRISQRCLEGIRGQLEVRDFRLVDRLERATSDRAAYRDDKRRNGRRTPGAPHCGHSV